jgi:hypothetical protein
VLALLATKSRKVEIRTEFSKPSALMARDCERLLEALIGSRRILDGK